MNGKLICPPRGVIGPSLSLFNEVNRLSSFRVSVIGREMRTPLWLIYPELHPGQQRQSRGKMGGGFKRGQGDR